VAEAVGFLPLALEVVAPRVREGLVTWTELEHALKAEVSRLEELEGSSRRRAGQARLQASLNLSLMALRGKDPAAYEKFAWLGVLPEDVPICAPMAATLWSVTLAEAGELLSVGFGQKGYHFHGEWGPPLP
jgi:hypothetical protein